MLIAALIIAALSIIASIIILGIFLRNKGQQKQLLGDDAPNNNQTPDGQIIFHSNTLIIVLYIVLLGIGTGVAIYSAVA